MTPGRRRRLLPSGGPPGPAPRPIRRRLLRSLLAAAAALALSSACSDDAASPGSTAATSSSPASATTEGGGGPSGGTASSAPRSSTPGPATSPQTAATVPGQPTTPGPTASSPGPTASSPGPTASSPTVGPAAGRCPALAALPSGRITESGRRAVDVDADGTVDVVHTFLVAPPTGAGSGTTATAAAVAGSWRMRVELGGGGGAEYILDEDPSPAPFALVGTAYVGSDVSPGAGGRRPLIFAWSSSGASAKVISLYRFDGCAIVPVTFPGGGAASIVAGGSVGHQEGARCEGVAGTSLLVVVTSESSVSGGSYTITAHAYSRADNALVDYGQPVVTTSPVPPPEASRIGCGDVSLS